MSHLHEKPFEYLRRKENGKKFDDAIVKNWYIARAFVLEKLEHFALRPDSKDHLHVVVADDSPLMLSVVRQVALSAHYINYKEDVEDDSHRHRTVISLVSNNPNIKKELEKEEYLCNLPKYCKYVGLNSKPENTDSFIDIEIHIIEHVPENGHDENTFVFSEEDVNAFCESKKGEGVDIFSIDTLKAVYTKRMYDIGETIDNLPSEDIHCASRYTLALNVYQFEKLRIEPMPMIDEKDWENPIIVLENISNIFCSDCFESRYLAVKLCSDGIKKEETAIWEKYNDVLSKNEHARWVVEKLILGYSPLNKEQHFKDESLSINMKKRKLYRKELKKDPQNPVHIDLCSYADLRRINPDDLKYDSFLMLAIPKILEKVR